jgi:hypothetical protein
MPERATIGGDRRALSGTELRIGGGRDQQQ